MSISIVKLGINMGFYTDDEALGSAGKEEFYVGVDKGTGPNSGAIIRSMVFYYGRDRVLGIEVKLTDGNHSLVGKRLRPRRSKKISFENGEKIEVLKIWPGGTDGLEIGKVLLQTDGGQQLDLPIEPPHGAVPHQPEIGSGILVGVFGEKTGANIDCLGFALLKKVKSAELFNVQYVNYQGKTVSASPVNQKNQHFENSRNKAITKVFRGSFTEPELHDWSKTTGLEYCVSNVSVTAKVPVMVSAAFFSKLEISEQEHKYKQRSVKDSTTKRFREQITVYPDKTMDAVAVLYKSDINNDKKHSENAPIDYIGTMKYNLDSKQSFSYQVEGGKYTGTTTSLGVMIQEIDETAEE